MTDVARFDVPARWWHTLPDGRVQCDVCPRHCRLESGQRGACWTRARRGNSMVSTTYGRVTDLLAQPIEKKPLFHFLPGTRTLSLGTAGCNGRCRFCRRWRPTVAQDLDALAVPVRPEEVATLARDLGCRSVAFSFNEPAISLEFVVDVAAACRPLGLRTVVVTGGLVCEGPRAELISAVDAVSFEVKAFDERTHASLSGARLEPALDFLRWLTNDTSVWVEVAMVLIPGWTDEPEQTRAFVRWVRRELGSTVPLHFLRFRHGGHVFETRRTPLTTLRHARELARDEGLRHVYVEDDPAGQTTDCARCATSLIRRTEQHGTQCWLTPDGTCPSCGAALARRFDAVLGAVLRARPSASWAPDGADGGA